MGLGWTLYEGDDYHSKESIDKMARGEPLTDQVDGPTPWVLTSSTVARLAQFVQWTNPPGCGSRGSEAHLSRGSVPEIPDNVALEPDRIPWLLQLHGIIQREITSKANAIVLCSALKRAYRQMLLFGRTCLPSSDSPTAVDGVWFAFLHGPFKLIQERLEAREGHYMSAALLQSQFDTLEPPVDTENAFSVDVQRSIPEVASDIESALSVRL
ncbi:hypothetical protein Z043_113558 [Scleropages formosus]|uniref:gluconokinase n=1 Tax=Scleropages formosus TaxID=113540 RepID=A0A0N8JYY2_SCLFO|nr:hypothetical protein Z043_113558 [Scleropages formosus]